MGGGWRHLNRDLYFCFDSVRAILIINVTQFIVAVVAIAAVHLDRWENL